MMDKKDKKELKKTINFLKFAFEKYKLAYIKYIKTMTITNDGEIGYLLTVDERLEDLNYWNNVVKYLIIQVEKIKKRVGECE